MSLPVLCRAGGHTCAACCHGPQVPRARLERQLARQTALFERLTSGRGVSRLGLLLHELWARGLPGVVWGMLLLLPLVGECLAWWLRPRVVCAFLGFEDEGRTRVGCLIHPARQAGRDVRRQAAFALWRGFGCGAGDWQCPAARQFALADWRQRRDFARRTEGLDWAAYEEVAASFQLADGCSQDGRMQPR
jgi:hypothetical protein